MKKDERKDVETKNEDLSISKRAAEAGVPLTTYLRRIARGFSEEELHRKPGVYDHKGQRFPTIRHMCDHYGISETVFHDRKNAGWDLERTLTTEAKRSPAKEVTDHLGNKYPSINAMCREYGILPRTYRSRIEDYHMTQEEALTKDVKGTHPGGAKKCVDHYGKEFSSVKKMCEYHGVCYKTFEERRRRGWDIERALQPAEKTAKREGIVYAPDGTEFQSLRKMSEAYGINYRTLIDRLKVQKMTLTEALTLSVANRGVRTRPGYWE